MNRRLGVTLSVMLATCALVPAHAAAQEEPPVYLRDRGTGIATSMFGTYARAGELLVYPFYEYYHDNNLEYEPADFGFGSTQEFRGRYRAHEGLIFLGYGITDRLIVEVEAGIIDATLDKAPQDASPTPATLAESGLSDVEAQLRWRWSRETDTKPEIFSYLETTFPLSAKNSLIGTSAWEFKLGTGMVRGFRWGTVTLRAAIAYTGDGKKFEPGEYALEYLKRLSNTIRVFAMIEGSEDEVELVPEVQLHLGERVYLKIGSGFALTSKATDIAPEVGVMFIVPTR